MCQQLNQALFRPVTAKDLFAKSKKVFPPRGAGGPKLLKWDLPGRGSNLLKSLGPLTPTIPRRRARGAHLLRTLTFMHRCLCFTLTFEATVVDDSLRLSLDKCYDIIVTYIIVTYNIVT